MQFHGHANGVIEGRKDLELLPQLPSSAFLLETLVHANIPSTALLSCPSALEKNVILTRRYHPPCALIYGMSLYSP